MAFLNPEIVNLGIEPISSPAPAGEPVRFDPQFEQLSNEIAKTESLSQTAVDWAAVAELSSALLKAKSKDFRIASYLTLALLQTRGLEGLLNGLALYRNLLQNFWETGFPEKARMRGRVGALQWLSERLPPALSRKGVSGPDDLVLELEQSALDFNTSVDALFANEAPSFVEMLQLVRQQGNDIRSRRLAAEQAKGQQQRTEVPDAPDATDVADVDRVLENCRTRLYQVAGMMRDADPANPLAYQLSRGTTWGWTVSPPTHSDGITNIQPPGPDVIQSYERLLAARNWAGIVQETESNFLDRVFVFDFQYHCVQALTELGESYVAAKKAVVSELRCLLTRVPEIVSLKFSDGTAIFGPAAAEWISQEMLAGGNGSASGQGKPASGSAEDTVLKEAIAEGHRLSSAGELRKAIEVFKAGIAAASQRRRRFLWRLELAKFCIAAGKPQVALPQLTLLDEEVTRFSLEEWEPDLALAVLQQLFHCRQSMAANRSERPPEVEQQMAKLYERLCRLDVNTALTVEL